jgi:hypothetical protein
LALRWDGLDLDGAIVDPRAGGFDAVAAWVTPGKR